jgi:hypothetical protein
MQDRLAQFGVHLMNVNGLLNLYAWFESLEGHLIPHGQFPDDSAGTRIPRQVIESAKAIWGYLWGHFWRLAT